MQSGRCTALQLKESTKSMPCTQKGRVAHIHSYVLGGETGPSLLDETTLSFLDGQAMTAHAALCLCHESTWQSQRCLARTKMDGLTQSVDTKMQSKVDTSTGKDAIVRWIRPPSAKTMGRYLMAGARTPKPVNALQNDILPACFGDTI